MSEARAKELYELILRTANKFLRNAKMFEIHVLRDHNPTYDELARIMHQVAIIIYELVDDIDPLLAQKAADYVYLMQNMGIAIRDNDEARLQALTKELDGKPFL